MQHFKKFIKTIIKKREGNGDLIASMFVVLALTLFVFFFINVIGDINTRIQLDQIARKYILYMESAGELTDDNKNNLIDDLKAVQSVSKAINGGGSSESEIDVAWSTNKGKEQKAGYAGTITLTIKCPAVTTGYISNEGALGTIRRNVIRTYVITKSSTSKY